ncbi:hypothetical protein FDP41_001259 [Naegleria fowleri]|uniref:Uncharacterized protein n=1 Tax=Naegleria fowleri TaxID=5763 RepID=A0A6A5BYI8_NAEFO|nr:uncharacterized protein FDP41_001259 [Naegleria fowleri]KAF0979591.1 hypothetical protein FDP41_001259 [Naegleria fowleri]
MVMHQTQQNNRRTTRSSATTTTTTTSTNNTFTTTTTDQQQEQQQTQQFDETTTNHDAFDRRQQQKDFDHQILSHAFPFSTHDSTSVSNFITDVKVDPKRKLLLASTYSSGRVYVFDLDTRKFLYSIQVGDRSGCCYYLTIEEPFRHENDLIMMKGLSTTSSTTGTTSTTSSTTTTTTNEDENRHMPSSMTWDQETIQMACTYPSVIVTTDMYSYYTIEKFIMCPTLYEPNVRTATRLSNHRSRMWKCTSSEFNALRGLCVDHSSRRLFVSDRDASKIRVLSSRDGHLLKSFAFNAPTDLAFYEGNLFVCEKINQWRAYCFIHRWKYFEKYCSGMF